MPSIWFNFFVKVKLAAHAALLAQCSTFKALGLLCVFVSFPPQSNALTCKFDSGLCIILCVLSSLLLGFSQQASLAGRSSLSEHFWTAVFCRVWTSKHALLPPLPLAESRSAQHAKWSAALQFHLCRRSSPLSCTRAHPLPPRLSASWLCVYSVFAIHRAG